MKKQDNRKGHVYFIEAQNGLIKIGHSVNVKSRLSSIRTMSPIPLTLLGVIPGTWRDEQVIHRRFSEHVSHGEWFNPCHDLCMFIEKNITPFEQEPVEQKSTKIIRVRSNGTEILDVDLSGPRMRRTCRLCGSVLPKQRTRRREYCSRSCQGKAYRQRRIMEEKTK